MADLEGLKVLVVEDEGAVALLIEDMLLDLGCQLVSSAATLAKATELASTVDIDIALLDLNLDGAPSLSVASILREREIPFVFSTGYGAAGISAEFDSYPVLAKPFVLADLRAKMSAALESVP